MVFFFFFGEFIPTWSNSPRLGWGDKNEHRESPSQQTTCHDNEQRSRKREVNGEH